MNVISRLTRRHMGKNRRRTLVTIVGVIISVAMITAVAVIGFSVLDLMQRVEVETGGEWHVRYNDLTAEQAAAVGAHENTKSLALERVLGYAEFPESADEKKPYFFLQAYNTARFENFPVKLVEGRFPQAPGEAVVSVQARRVGDDPVRIGEQLTLSWGERRGVLSSGEERALNQTWYLGEAQSEYLVPEHSGTFTIVGTIERPSGEQYYSPGYSLLCYLDAAALAPDERVDARVALNHISTALYDEAETIAENIGMESLNGGREYDLDFNNGLLKFYGVTRNDSIRTTMFLLVGSLMLIIFVGSVSLIYNAFSISIAERSRDLGMLATVGATRAQKRWSVFYESILVGLISIPIGILCGTVGIGITFRFVGPMLRDLMATGDATLRLVVPPAAVLLSAAVAAATLLVSAWVPARRASKIAPIDAIRQSDAIKLSRRTVKTSRLTRALFGFEGEIAMKNIKRQRGRYRVTIFSLCISIVLFLSVSSFTQMLRSSYEMTGEDLGYDVRVWSYHADTDTVDGIYDRIQQMSQVEAYTRISELDGHAELDRAQMSDDMAARLDPTAADDETFQATYSVNLTALDDSSWSAYLEACGFRESDFAAEGLQAVLVNRFRYRENSGYQYAQLTTMRPGDELTVIDDDLPQGELTVRIAQLANEPPDGMSDLNLWGNLIVVVPERALCDLLGEDAWYQSRWGVSLFLKTNDDEGLLEEIDALTKGYSSVGINVFSVEDALRSERNLNTVITVFTTGFLVLITLICVANIFNTISTSVALRRREFAMLRSVGMTPGSFNRMIFFESFFYGAKALLYGLPISFACLYWFYLVFTRNFGIPFSVPWGEVGFAVAAVFVLVFATMFYAMRKLKRVNIVDALKEETL
ncbi:FtsX-like permease family protein [Feifania hominis]|uniref:FtsX-like permease family protein n=1 Tax=Feifania hominis TaxID=2763660 RepID=A0A926DEK8_9FIRM|nr:FtsX-like permease family protein [Feifania hominis]MBC8537188.1 FtsX-like permease family protein [Feifania hominis]